MVLDKRDKLFQFLQEGLPLERITQEKFFFNSLFYVNKDVLVPRNETEVLVEYAINYCNKYNVKSVVEVGVGSGCILLSLLKESMSIEHATAIDICPEALAVFEINHFRMKNSFPGSPRLVTSKDDRLMNFSGNVDLIISNPPYIDRSAHGNEVHWQADRYEPDIALYLEGETYEKWFDLFFQQVKRSLKPNGAFFMEGHEDKWDVLEKIADKYFNKVEIMNDLTGTPRFLIAGEK